ncbi:MAG: hypothetical protein S4CHLAM2_04980 [Chlamydiales bacterium]|nr:hypothetical protein [Chlamydiales bacterium]
MSSFLPNNHYSVSSAPAAPLGRLDTQHILAKEIARTQDTITESEKKHTKSQVEVGERPILPAAASSKHPDFLAFVAEAFSRSFSAMSQGTISQSQDFAALQKLDQTMSQAVLQTTKNAIDKQQAQIKMAASVKAYQEKMGQANTIFQWTMFAIGIVLMVVTVASSVFDFGASLAAVPAEAGMIEMADFGATATSEGVGAAIDVGEEAASNVAGFTEDLGSEVESTAQEGVSDEVNSETSFKSKVADMLKTKGFKKGVQFGVGTVLASPMLVEGIEKLHTGDMLDKVAQTQKETGDAMATMQANQMTFQFYQQLLRRASGVVQEQGNDASQVVETFNDVASAYKQISYGLASAV